ITARSEAEAGLAAATAERVESSREVAVEGTRVHFRVARGPAILPEYLRALDAEGLPAQTAEVRRPTLDDVFLALTGRSLREGAPVAEGEGEGDAAEEMAGVVS